MFLLYVQMLKKTVQSYSKGRPYTRVFEDPPKLSENINDDEKILNIYRRVRDEILDFILNINHYI